MAFSKELRRLKIRRRIRASVQGDRDQPRLSVFRSNNDIYAQLIDDRTGKTLVSMSSRSADLVKFAGSKVEKANEVGRLLAVAAMERGVEKIVFDRGGYLYHGRVKALAEGAREAGLKF